MQDGDFAGHPNSVNGVQAQAVEAVFTQPKKRILDGEAADFAYPIIDCAAPGRLRVREEAGSIAAKIISFGAEVIVNDVEKHHEAAHVSLIDQGFQVVG